MDRFTSYSNDHLIITMDIIFHFFSTKVLNEGKYLPQSVVRSRSVNKFPNSLHENIAMCTSTQCMVRTVASKI